MEQLPENKDFWKEIDPSSVIELFEHLPEIRFFVKDSNSRFLHNNQASILRKPGLFHKSQVLNKTDFDFSPASYAINMVQDDQQIMSTGKKIINQLELVPNHKGGMEWSNTTKVPLRNRSGEVIGVVGFTRGADVPMKDLPLLSELSPAIEYIMHHATGEINVTDIAKSASMSISQLERKFKKALRLTPAKFIIQVRLKSACHALIATQKNITQIATENGFTNIGAFSAQFKSEMGITPKEYRRNFSS